MIKNKLTVFHQSARYIIISDFAEVPSNKTVELGSVNEIVFTCRQKLSLLGE